MPSGKGLNCDLKELLQYQSTISIKVPPRNVRSNQAGQHVSNFRGRGMDFSEVRSYQAGDDIRQMEWRVTARTGKPHVKLYHEEKERPVFIVTDYNPSMFFGTKVAYKSVIASRFASMLGFAASQHGDRVGGIVFSGDELVDIKPRARRHGVLPLIKHLSEFSNKPAQLSKDLDQVLLQLRQVVKPGALVFILSDFENLGQQFEGYLKRLCMRADVVCYLISDPLERLAPTAGHYFVTDGQQEMMLDTTVKKIREQYQAHYKQKFEHLSQLIKPGRLVSLSTDSDLESHLQNAFASFRDWRRG